MIENKEKYSNFNITDKIIINKEKYNFFKKAIKTFNSFDNNKYDIPINTEPNSNSDNKIQIKKLEDYINENESKNDFNKKKRPLREYHLKKKLIKKTKNII